MLPPILDERVLDRIKPVTRELVADIASEIDCVELTIDADSRLEIVPASHSASPGLKAAARDLIEAWTATGQPFTVMRFSCRREEEGWNTKLSI